MKAIGAQIGDFIQHKYSEDQLIHIAHHDILTGLLNRSTLSEKLNTICANPNQLCALVLLDINRFKLINDVMGHDAGDALLQMIAERLHKFYGQSNNMIGRLGSDKFILVFTHIKDIKEIIEEAPKILQLFTEPFFVKGRELSITANAGISLYPQDGKECGTFLQSADTALAQAKKEGVNYFALMIVVTDQDPKTAIASYLRRWEIESLFQCLKGRGFNFESTHITDLDRLTKLTALLAIGFIWAHNVGEIKAEIIKPIIIKQFHGQQRPQYSYFRYGLDCIRETVLHIYKKFWLLKQLFNLILPQGRVVL